MALEIFKTFQSDNKGLVFDVFDLLEPNEADPSLDAKEHKLELLNTHTYYYLAQVYEKIGEKDKAGECCHITLRKQLELKEYSSISWVTNAYTLSHYYLSRVSGRSIKYEVL